jgi:hypothetical protein
MIFSENRRPLFGIMLRESIIFCEHRRPLFGIMLKVGPIAVAPPGSSAEPAVGKDDPLISAPTLARRASKRTGVVGQMQIIPQRPEAS